MHTEEQAKQLWCPMVRHEGDIASFNRGARNSNPTNQDKDVTNDRLAGFYGCHCIASRCAMWRVSYTPTRRYLKAENPRAMTEAEAGAVSLTFPAVFYSDADNEGEGAGWLETEWSVSERLSGYCGLAGRPGAAA